MTGRTPRSESWTDEGGFKPSVRADRHQGDPRLHTIGEALQAGAAQQAGAAAPLPLSSRQVVVVRPLAPSPEQDQTHTPNPPQDWDRYYEEQDWEKYEEHPDERGSMFPVMPPGQNADLGAPPLLVSESALPPVQYNPAVFPNAGYSSYSPMSWSIASHPFPTSSSIASYLGDMSFFGGGLTTPPHPLLSTGVFYGPIRPPPNYFLYSSLHEAVPPVPAVFMVGLASAYQAWSPVQQSSSSADKPAWSPFDDSIQTPPESSMQQATAFQPPTRLAEVLPPPAELFSPPTIETQLPGDTNLPPMQKPEEDALSFASPSNGPPSLPSSRIAAPPPPPVSPRQAVTSRSASLVEASPSSPFLESMAATPSLSVVGAPLPVASYAPMKVPEIRERIAALAQAISLASVDSSGPSSDVRQRIDACIKSASDLVGHIQVLPDPEKRVELRRELSASLSTLKDLAELDPERYRAIDVNRLLIRTLKARESAARQQQEPQ